MDPKHLVSSYDWIPRDNFRALDLKPAKKSVGFGVSIVPYIHPLGTKQNLQRPTHGRM